MKMQRSSFSVSANGSSTGLSNGASTLRRHLVCHLIDDSRNLHMPFFRLIERDHNRDEFPVTFCMVQSPGPLQNPKWEVKTPAASLDVVPRWKYPLAVLRLARLLRQKRVSVLHAHLYEPTLIGLAAARLAGVHFVFTRHHSDHNIRTGKRRHVFLDAWSARLADQAIAVSEATREIMMKVEGVPGNRITTVYNGMDLLRDPPTEAVERVRVELGLGAQPVILMIARLHEEKGHRFLLEALPRVIADVGPVQVLLAGIGPNREQIASQVAALALQETVRFLGRRQDVPELLALSTVAVLPSLAESFGYALVEAMCLGKPIVATACGGIPEVVGKEAAVLVPMANAAALAEGIVQVLRSPTLARRLGQAGRNRAQLFSTQRMLRGYEKVYQRVLGL